MNISSIDSETHRLMAKVLTLHFQQGQLQADIAKNLRLSTAKVNRLIKHGRELGMVEFKVRSPFQRFFEIEQKLKEKWQLQDCLVVGAVSEDAESILDQVGQAAAKYIRDLVHDDMTIAISGGKAVSAVAANLDVGIETKCQIVPLTGGVQGQHFTDVNHIAATFAAAFGGTANLIHAPLHADSKHERDMLLSVRSVKKIMDLAQSAHLSVVGIGSIDSENSTYYQAYPLSAEGKLSLYESGARGEFLGALVDEFGSICDNEHNSRLVSLPLQAAKEIPQRIGVASGADKVEPLKAVLQGSHLSSLIIDEKTALQVLSG